MRLWSRLILLSWMVVSSTSLVRYGIVPLVWFSQFFPNFFLIKQVIYFCLTRKQCWNSSWKWAALTKGLLISKCLFSVFDSPKKRTWISKFCPSLLGQTTFVLFLAESKTPRSLYEINWPLHNFNFQDNHNTAQLILIYLSLTGYMLILTLI